MKHNKSTTKEYAELIDRVGRACGDIVKRFIDEANKSNDPEEKLMWSYACGKVSGMMDNASDLLRLMEGNSVVVSTLPEISITDSKPETKSSSGSVMDWLDKDLSN